MSIAFLFVVCFLQQGSMCKDDKEGMIRLSFMITCVVGENWVFIRKKLDKQVHCQKMKNKFSFCSILFIFIFCNKGTLDSLQKKYTLDNYLNIEND